MYNCKAIHGVYIFERHIPKYSFETVLGFFIWKQCIAVTNRIGLVAQKCGGVNLVPIIFSGGDGDGMEFTICS